jgi:hypothetical protein
MRPEHMTLTIRAEAGYCSLDTPAESAPAYEHQLQQKARILGLNSSDIVS